MYLGDPREDCIREDGRILETGNRKGTAEDGTEIRYRWNGLDTDFCELPPSDYGKTIFHTKPAED